VTPGKFSLKNTRAAVIVFGVLVSQVTSPAGNLSRYEYFRILMGTKMRIVLYAESEELAREAAAAAFLRIQQLDEIMSDYKPESELMKLCREAYQVARPVSADLFRVLEESLRFSDLSHGAFDVTVGPVVALWREARRHKRLPDEKKLEEALGCMGYRKIVLNAENRSVRLGRPCMKLDLGGIGQGYAADQALAVLAARGIRSALVDAGGDIAMSAAPPDRPGWKVALQRPAPAGEAPPEDLTLYDCGVTTSGDTEQFVELEGIRYSHIIDPETGWATRDSASVTVIAPDATTADALATALSVLPPDRALRLTDSQPGVAAVIVRRSGDGLTKHVSRRMAQYLDRNR
jgi:FAD:protein FMN transferase